MKNKPTRQYLEKETKRLRAKLREARKRVAELMAYAMANSNQEPQ